MFLDWVLFFELLMLLRLFKEGIVIESLKFELVLFGGFDFFLGILCWEEGVLLFVWRWLLFILFIFCVVYIVLIFVLEWFWFIDIWFLIWFIGKLFGGLCFVKWFGFLVVNCVYKYG